MGQEKKLEFRKWHDPILLIEEQKDKRTKAKDSMRMIQTRTNKIIVKGEIFTASWCRHFYESSSEKNSKGDEGRRRRYRKREREM